MKVSKKSSVVVRYGPWVPKPVVPPLAPAVKDRIVEIQREGRRLPRVLKLVRDSAEAALARDEILGI
jgi:hypothetical protein